MPAGLPSPRIVFALALAVFAGGFTLGTAAGPSAQTSYAAGAAAPGQVVVIVSPPVAAAAPQTVTVTAPAPPALPPVTQAPAAAAPAPPVATEPVTTTTTTDTQTTTDTTPTTTTAPALPPIKHVWLVVLTGHGLQDGFGPDSHSVLLRETLPKKGVLLLQHKAVASGSLANGLALISGVTPTPDMTADCPTYGQSCMVPADQQALTDQLTGAGLTWKAYVEGLAPAPVGAPQACGHAVSPRDPFLYVNSIVDSPECGTNVVGLDALATDLAKPETTPSFSYVVPDRCHDGTDVPCTDGAYSGTAATDGWLRTVLREIRSSASYRKDGLILVTFDSGPPDQPVGALLLSHFLAPGTTSDTPSDHRTLLATVEDLFGLTHLAGSSVAPLAADVLAKPSS